MQEGEALEKKMGDTVERRIKAQCRLQSRYFALWKHPLQRSSTPIRLKNAPKPDSRAGEFGGICP